MQFLKQRVCASIQFTDTMDVLDYVAGPQDAFSEE